MADVPGKFFSATKVRTGVAPSSSGSLVGEPLPPVNPPGSSLNSVGLTMPSAFTVSNSPLTANGTIGVAGAGTVGQYIRGDGSLADFPESSGGGSSVSYYLNGSISQGTIGGVAYKELNKVPILGAGTDFTINADGYIASFITDAGDPNLLEIPGGNWNFETYFSASSSGGTPTFYVELYKYDGTTFTLIASSSSSPELIAFGTNLNPYFSTLAVPTTTLALTDRLAIRYYVTHSGRTITLHTENNHLCQVVTTFTTGLTSLNGLTAQVQNLAVGTSGTDFNIASATATHTFNLPTASATNRGALSSADWTTFNNKQNALGYVPVPETRTITINGTSQDLSANRTYNVGTVTSVAALTLGTSGTDLSSTVANGTTTPVITLNVPTASATNRGALSAADWTTFNNKQNTITLTTTGTSGAATLVGSTLNIPQYQAAGTYVTSVTASSPLASSGGTTPNITIQQASGSQNGFLSSTDWTTFNGKQNALTNPITGTGVSGQIAYFNGTTSITSESNLFWDSTNDRLGIGTPTPSNPLHIVSNTLSQLNIQALSGNTNAQINLEPSGTGIALIGPANNVDLAFRTNASIKLRLDKDGNLGLGVTPSAWNSAYKAMQFGTTGAIFGESGDAANYFTTNTFVDSVGFKYITSDWALGYFQENGVHSWRNAPSGTAGNAISFTQAMTLFSTGNLLVGSPSPISDNGARLQVSGTAIFSSSVTALNLDLKGTATVQGNTFAPIDFYNSGNIAAAIRPIRYNDETAADLTFWTREYLGSLTERLKITYNGNVGIGTTSPNYLLHIAAGAANPQLQFSSTGTGSTTSDGFHIGVNNSTLNAFLLQKENAALQFLTNDTERMRITAGGEVLIGNTDNGAYNLQCNGTGVWGQGAYVNGSDRNIKDNIATIEKGLEYIQKMNPVKFRYKPNYTRDHSMQTGFIAQELQEVFASEDYLSGLVQQGVHLSVAYQNLLPVLVKAIQELKQEIDTLKN